jgi:hypothetical protein
MHLLTAALRVDGGGSDSKPSPALLAALPPRIKEHLRVSDPFFSALTIQHRMFPGI